ncbi:MAG: hypothetical protein M1821_002438 [Bathelium mastoideum]|nr:MAG: hypothetical protein M1821_002438 [Bathelium mastoideum]
MRRITIDTLARFFKRTAFNPVLTLPLVLYALYTQNGQHLAALHKKAFKRLRQALLLGLIFRTSDALDRLVANNWTRAKYDWKKEIAVVTGGSDGVGKIIVQLLAERGTAVCVLDIQPLTYEGNSFPGLPLLTTSLLLSYFPLKSDANLNFISTVTPPKFPFNLSPDYAHQTPTTAPPNVTLFHCDLSSPTAINAAANRIRATIGSPTILINNAGLIRAAKDLLNLTPTDLRLTFAINALAPYHLAQQFLPYMLQTNHGTIATITSTAAFLTAPRLVPYAAAKAAALAFHEGLAAELATLHAKAPAVRTVLVAPGYMRTSLFEGFHPGDGFVTYALQPETVAEAVVRQVWSGESGYVFLPERSAKWLCVPVRGWPLWMQIGFRKRLVGLMEGFRGRAVVQPSEVAEEERKREERGLGESMVSI